MKPIKVKTAVPMKMHSADQPTFERWLERCDLVLRKARWISIYDLPDCSWRDWYDERLRPIRAVNRAIRYARTF